MDEFSHESVEDRESIVKYIKALEEGFTNGQITFNNEQEKLELTTSERIKLEVKVKKKNGNIKFSLKFRWKEEDYKKNKGPLIISPS